MEIKEEEKLYVRTAWRVREEIPMSRVEVVSQLLTSFS
jgi:hypothetical protein